MAIIVRSILRRSHGKGYRLLQWLKPHRPRGHRIEYRVKAAAIILTTPNCFVTAVPPGERKIKGRDSAHRQRRWRDCDRSQSFIGGHRKDRPGKQAIMSQTSWNRVKFDETGRWNGYITQITHNCGRANAISGVKLAVGVTPVPKQAGS